MVDFYELGRQAAEEYLRREREDLLQEEVLGQEDDTEFYSLSRAMRDVGMSERDFY